MDTMFILIILGVLKLIFTYIDKQQYITSQE